LQLQEHKKIVEVHVEESVPELNVPIIEDVNENYTS